MKIDKGALCPCCYENLEVGIASRWGSTLEQNHEKDRMMDGTMKEKDKIREELTELLNTYYNGSFVQLVCDYIRSTGMTPQEVEWMLEEMRKVKGA